MAVKKNERTIDSPTAVEETERTIDLSINPKRISDWDSFNEVTEDPHQVAGLYFYSMLDCLVDLAHKVSYDFFKKPHLYMDLGSTDLRLTQYYSTDLEAKQSKSPPLSLILAKLHAQYGSNEFFPSTEQRDAIYLPIFGRGASYSATEEGDFPRLRDELIDAAAAFSERVFDTGVEMLKERVRTTHRPFRDYLIGLQGDSVKWSREYALPLLTEDVSYTILRNKGVAGIFGIDKSAQMWWPYKEDANGDKLVEAISKQLMWADQPEDKCITREYFSNLQRAALRGAEAIATIIAFQEELGDTEKERDNNLNLLITRCYTWGAALMSLRSHQKTAQPTPAVKDPGIARENTSLYKSLK